MRLKDKVVIITGGGRGIGRGISNAFVKEGAAIVITGRNESALIKTQKEIEDDIPFARVLPIVADGSNEEDIQKAISQTIETFGRLDAIINNAQSGLEGKIEDYSFEQFKIQFETGVFASFLYMKYALPYLKDSRGSIVNFGSAAGFNGLLEHGSYAAAKEAVRGLSRVAANEWGQYGINVNVICPAAMTEGVEQWKNAYPEQFAGYLANVPMRRVGDSEKDIGAVCVFLCTEDAKYITGETISVDGGCTLRP